MPSSHAQSSHLFSSSFLSVSQQELRSAHPLDQLVLHLLPGCYPGITQNDLMKRVQRALPNWPDLHMVEVSLVVLSSVLTRLERNQQVDANGEGAERWYWRRIRDPLT